MGNEDEDSDEFGLFMAERWPRLVRSAYLLTGDRHHAEDLAQDLAQAVLTKVYVSWSRVRRADDVDAYLRRVLVNCNASRFRKRRVDERLVAAVPEAARLVSGADGDQTEQRGTVMAALAELPPRQRAVIVMRFYEDLTEAQTASVLGCSVGTVKSQTSKAFAKLRVHPELAACILATSEGEAA